jgi:ParB-like chromosome segregation protein Spo0J
MSILYQIEHLPLASLVPYARNARTHSAAQVAQIVASIEEFGWTNPVLIDAGSGIIAGHGRVLAAKELGMAMVPCLRLGHLTDAQKRAYVIADNKLALNAGWDEAMLGLELSALQMEGFNTNLIGFDGEELQRLMNGDPLAEDDESVYTRKVEAPIYQPSGPKPELADLYDDRKTRELYAEIETAEIPEDIKQFLRVAADRHTILNFARIANYYAQSDAATQDLMERSALVIIDFNKAIEYGFVNLTEEICQQYAVDYPDA